MIPSQITDTTESRALCYFLTHYIQVAPEEEPCKSYIDSLVPLYLDSNMSHRLYHATSAVSMLTLAKKSDTRAHVEASRINYGKAVALLREAVSNPRESRTDDTLMTAMILSLYDSIDADRDAPSAWRHHIDGAFAMLTLRQHETLSSPLSQKIYWAVKFHAAVNHVMRCEPMEPFPDWTQLWNKPLPMAYPIHDFDIVAHAAFRLPALRHAASRILREPISPRVALDILKLLGNVKVLDAELACWPFSMPAALRPSVAGWRHKDLADDNNRKCYPGAVYSYYNWWIANVWNVYRALRCFCQGLIQSCVARLVPEELLEESPENSGASRTLQRLADEICGTVPLCLGDTTGFEIVPQIASPASETRAQDDNGTPQGPEHERSIRWPKNAMSAYLLIWILETAASIPSLPPKQRMWVLGRLEEIGTIFGINLATVTATELRRAMQAGSLTTATHLETLSFAPYPDLEELWEEDNELDPRADLSAPALKVERCIADLARQYSGLQVG